MSWFNTKKGEPKNFRDAPRLPELPQVNFNSQLTRLPELPELPEIPLGLDNIEVHPLPPQPQKSPSQLLPPIPAFRQKNLQEPAPMIPNTPRTIEMSLQKPEEIKPSLKESEPIYIRLDKFQTTAESFEEIKKRIKEIEAFLSKAKDIRAEEDKELEDWEKELLVIKSRLDSIDKNLFNKLE